MSRRSRIIGIDLDNTLISYDGLIHRCAVDAGLVSEKVCRHKKTIRDLIRQLPEGELRWVQIQAYIYGEGITGAEPFEGALEFLQECRQQQIPVYIISHKTEHCVLDGKQIDLREHALGWLAKNGFFDHRRSGFDREQVFFESTREAKVGRIRTLRCTHFIDDLEEVFVRPDFPTTVERLLFDPHTEDSCTKGMRIFHTWRSIRDHFFGKARRGNISDRA